MSGKEDRVTLDDVEVALWRTLRAQDVETVETVLKVVQAYAQGEVERKVARGRVEVMDGNRRAVVVDTSGTNAMSEKQKRELEQALEVLEKDPAWKHRVEVGRQEPRAVEASEWPFNLVDGETRAARSGYLVEGSVEVNRAPVRAVPRTAQGGPDMREENPLKEGHPPFSGDGRIMRKEGHPPFSGDVKGGSPSFFSENVPESEDLETEKDFFGMLHQVVEEARNESGNAEPGNSEELLGCKRCGKRKKAEHFAVDRSRSRGRRWNCRLCEADIRREKTEAKVRKAQERAQEYGK